MDYLTPASYSEPHCFYSRPLDRTVPCSISDFWTLFISSAFEALEIEAAFKHIISKVNLQKRWDRLSEQLTEEELCATLQKSLALALGPPLGFLL